MLIICDSILRRELQAHNSLVDISALVEVYNRIQAGLGVEIKSGVVGCKLYKARVVTNNGMGRVIFLLVVDGRIFTPVLLRTKKDKKIGANMSMANASFRKELHRNLDLIFEDLGSDRFREI